MATVTVPGADYAKSLGYTDPDPLELQGAAEEETAARSYLKDLGYTNPDMGEIAGAAEDMPKERTVISPNPAIDATETNITKLAETTKPVEPPKTETPKATDTSTTTKTKYGAVGPYGNPTGAQYLDGSGNAVDAEGYRVDADGNRIIINGQPVKSEALWDASTGKKVGSEVVEGQSADYNKELDWVSGELKNLYSDDTMLNQQIANINATYANRIKQMEDLNMRALNNAKQYNFRTGSIRYAGPMTDTLLTEHERQGLVRINELEQERQSLILKAQEAARSGKFEILGKYMEAIQKKQDQRNKEVENATKVALEMNKLLEERRKEEVKAEQEQEKSINDIMLDAQKNGATPEVIDAISAAGSVAEAVKAAGEFLQGGSGIVGEYLYYKREAQAKGVSYVGFNEYQNIDANRKIAIAKAATGAMYNMTPAQLTNFNRIVTKMEKSPLLVAQDKAAVLKSLVEQIKIDPENNALQLSLIYGYIKALDMYDSAVREGEIGLVQSILGYKQKLEVWATNLTDNKQILDQDTALSIARNAETLIDVIDTGASRKVQGYRSEARIGGVSDGFEQYLKDLNASYDPVANDPTMMSMQSEGDAEQMLFSIGEQNPELRSQIISLTTEVQPELGRPMTFSEVLQVLGATQ